MPNVRVDISEATMVIKDMRGAVIYSGPVTEHVQKLQGLEPSLKWWAERDSRKVLELKYPI